MKTDAGHLLHMPSHIDVLVGDYKAAVAANLHAIKADLRNLEFGTVGGQIGTFYAGYINHDYHMAVYAAMLGPSSCPCFVCTPTWQSHREI